MGKRPEPGGRVLVRMPRSLHAELVALAKTEGVSLNQLAVSALARMAARAAEGEAPAVSEHISAYETVDRLQEAEQLLQFLLRRLEQVQGESLPAIEQALGDIAAELSEPGSSLGKLASGLVESLKAPVTATAPLDDVARKERIKRRAKAPRA